MFPLWKKGNIGCAKNIEKNIKMQINGKKYLALNEIEFLFDCLSDKNWYFVALCVCGKKVKSGISGKCSR